MKVSGLRLSNWPDLPKDSPVFLAKAQIKKIDETNEDTYFLQDMYKLPPKDKWNKAILPLIENPPQEKGLFFNYFSAADFIHSPRKYTKLIHKKFAEISLHNGIKYGWLVFDFPTEDMCKRVISTNF